MKILYLSVLASQHVIEETRKHNLSFAGYAVQKFNMLVGKGLAANGTQVKALSTFFDTSKGFVWHHKKEKEGEILYKYIPSINIAPIRHAWILVYCFFYILGWGIFNKKQKLLVCDVLNVSACIGAVSAARLINLRRVGIMTDMPGLMVGRNRVQTPNTKKVTLNTKLNKSYLSYFTHYVFLTEKMNEAINVNHRPYIVMEGLVDNETKVEIEHHNRQNKRIILYAGGLHERYGLKMLTEAFMMIDTPDVELWLYGNGPFADVLPDYERQDPRIHYWGIQPNAVIVEAEHNATLLVNPRPTHEEFTQYSFPSKNMEYMVSGVPLLTTRLPGMPEEYYPYVYLFEEETTEGYANTLKKILSLSSDELHEKGLMGQKFVLDNKNKKTQGERIIELIKKE